MLNQGDKWKKPFFSGYTTTRLRICPLGKEDFKEISKIGMDLELYRFVSETKNGKSFEKWLKSVYKKQNYLFFSINETIVSINRKTTEHGQKFIGLMMLNRLSDLKIEIGGWIGKKFQKKGYGEELIKDLISVVKKTNKSLELYAEIQKENIHAEKVLVRAGFKAENENSSSCRSFVI